MIPAWLRSTAGSRLESGVSPAAEFPSQARYRLAAQNMLVLGENKPDIVHVDKLRGFSRSVTQKYEEASSLVRSLPKIDREGRTWDELERVFPNLASGKGVESPQPGEMRRGTLIQKFDMFPKPGQPIANFKRQSEQTPIQKTMKEGEARKRPILPGQRLFSHVAEITPRKIAEPEKLESAVEDVEAPEERLLPAADQRLSEPPPEPEPKSELSTISQKVPEELTPPESEVRMALPDISHDEGSLALAEGNDRQESPRELKPAIPMQGPPANLKLSKALPVIKPPAHQLEILKALPTMPRQGRALPPASRPTSSQNTVQRTPDHTIISKPAPIQPRADQPRADQPPAIQPQADQPHAIRPQAGQPLAIQPRAGQPHADLPRADHPLAIQPLAGQPHTDLPRADQPLAIRPQAGQPLAIQPAAPKNQEQEFHETPVSSPERIFSAPAAPKRDPTQNLSGDQPNIGMDIALAPLRKVIDHRRQSGEGLVRSISPGQIKQIQPSPQLQRPNLPLLSPEKYRFEINAARAMNRDDKMLQALTFAEPAFANQPRTAHLFPLKQAAEWNSRQQPSIRREDAPPSQTPPALDEKILDPVYARQPVPQPDQGSGMGITQAVQASNNVVQREGGTVSPPSSPSTDLTSLADDVFPYIKRLLEIERERTHGSLR